MTYWLSWSDEEAVLPLPIPDLYSKEVYLLPLATCDSWCCTDRHCVSQTSIANSMQQADGHRATLNLDIMWI